MLLTTASALTRNDVPVFKAASFTPTTYEPETFDEKPRARAGVLVSTGRFESLLGRSTRSRKEETPPKWGFCALVCARPIVDRGVRSGPRPEEVPFSRSAIFSLPG